MNREPSPYRRMPVLGDLRRLHDFTSSKLIFDRSGLPSPYFFDAVVLGLPRASVCLSHACPPLSSNSFHWAAVSLTDF